MGKLIYGVGINDANYAVSPRVNGRPATCRIYVLWNSMLMRCYSEKYHAKKPTYIGCSVDKEWHSFMAFHSWAVTQDRLGKQLDKDILIQGSRIYSPKNCVFVDVSVNNLLLNHASKQGKLPIGVSVYGYKYRAYCNYNAKQILIGSYSTPVQAHAAWQSSKADVIERTANEQTDARVKGALMLRVKQLRDDMANGRETIKL